MSLEIPGYALEAAERLINFYPAINAANPRVFVAGMVQLFSRYPEHLVAEAIDPANGLPSKCKFLPSLAEAKEFLEPRFLAWHRQQDMIERFNRKQISAPPRDEVQEKQVYEGFRALRDHLSSVPDVIETMRLNAKQGESNGSMVLHNCKSELPQEG